MELETITHTMKDLQAIMQLADELGYETKDLK